MTQAITIRQAGGADVLQLHPTVLGKPAKGEVLLRQEAVGVNFIDVYHRTGLYPLPYPSGIGLEAAGTVEALGEGVTSFKVGDRVAYCGGGVGAYATARLMPEGRLVKLPDTVSFEQAATSMLKGMTAHYLLYRTFPVNAGDVILVHAAAGGVGLLLCQWAKQLGVTVIGTVGNEEKATLARANGCDHTILYRKDDFVIKVKELTGGLGVDAVYDSVGQSTFHGSLDCLKRFGMMVSFGQSSGAIPPFDPAILSQKGSLYLTRPTLMHHIDDVSSYQANAKVLLSAIVDGILKVHVDKRYALAEAAQAHRDLESRNTSGALVLVP